VEPGEISHLQPWFLPDGRHFLYVASKLGQSTIYMADVDAADQRKSRWEIRQVQTENSARTPGAVFVPPGFLLLRRGSTLIAQRFDPDKAQISGEEQPVEEGVDRFSVSQNGVLVYETLGATIGRVQLTWLDRSGNVQGTVESPGTINWPAISPDGTKVAYDAVSAQARSVDLWVYDVARGTSSRITLGQIASDFPVWSPDGSRVAFRKIDPKSGGLYQVAVDGSAEELLDQPSGVVRNDQPGNGIRADDWSRDGRFIAEEHVNQQQREIWMLPMSKGKPGKRFPFLQNHYAEGWAKFSPDGKWLAYTSDETSRDEVYVQDFHPSPDRTSATGGGKVRISNNGGSHPVWSRDGKELYYIAADRKLMAVPIRGGAALNPGTPKELFPTQIARSISYWFDISRDGRFILPVRVQQGSRASMSVVLNWPSILKK
jgi:Tol biopolymer transport system component